jgi:hypothetical protein
MRNPTETVDECTYTNEYHDHSVTFAVGDTLKNQDGKVSQIDEIRRSEYDEPGKKDTQIVLVGDSQEKVADYSLEAAIRKGNIKFVPDARLTEFVAAAENHDDSIQGPAKLTSIQAGPTDRWVRDEGEALEAPPDEYRVECSCGKTCRSWQDATAHVEEVH